MLLRRRVIDRRTAFSSPPSSLFCGFPAVPVWWHLCARASDIYYTIKSYRSSRHSGAHPEHLLSE